MNPRTATAILALLAQAALAQAGPAREVRDGATVEAAISTDAPTRIRLDGQRIVNAVGNLHSTANCEAGPSAASAPAASLAASAVNPRGDLVLNCDLDKGEIFVRPAVGGSGKPISLFVSSQRATYTMLLRPTAMPAGTITLRDRTAAAEGAPSMSAKSGTARASGHVRALKAMLAAMADGRAMDGMQVEPADIPYALWAEADFRLIRKYEGRALVGESYRLRNIGTAPMVLAEQEFDRDGVNLMAIAIEQHTLRPGEATLVHVIKGGRP